MQSLHPGVLTIESTRGCGVRNAIAFLRDAAAFTAGPGLVLGDHYRVRIPGYVVHVITAPALIEQILVSHGDHFVKSRIYWRELRRIIGDAMGSLDGPRWEYLRHLQQPFFTPNAVQGYLPLVQQITTSELRRVAKSIDHGSDVNVLELFGEINTRILLAVLFGRDHEAAALEIAARIADGEAIIAWRSRFPWNPLLAWLTGANQRAARHGQFFLEYAERLASRRDAGSHRATEFAREHLLEALLRVANDNNAPRFPTTLVRNEIIVHLGAGTETQAVAESWILYLLWKHPDTLARIRLETTRVARTSMPTMEHAAHLTYTKQVVREALRLYPPSYALVRDCVARTELAGRQVEPGEVFFISVCGLHRNPRFWDDPTRFDPDRFHEQAASIRKYQYLPFGVGRHVCIGQHLAMPCIVLAIAQFAMLFEWTFHNPEIAPVGLSTLKPDRPMLTTLAVRD